MTTTEGFYRWRGHDAHYARCGATTATTHVVFLPGFGVGTFHYEAQLREGALGEDACAWALDFVGQGKSWPRGEEAIDGFAYSVDAWREQVEYFLREVVGREAYVCGNSLGGYVATYVAAAESSRDLVKGLILMNATPFWAFVPSDEESLGYKLAPWRGSLPVPGWIRAPIKQYWESFRSRANVRGLLSLVYANAEAIDDRLIRDIIEPTENKNALSTFCSVVWSPKSAMSFDDMTERIRDSNIPVALVYGKEDPWVVPLWGQRLKRAIPRAHYYELSPVGHCPAHEAPETVNSILSRYLQFCESTAEETQPPSGSADGRAKLIDGAPRNIFERIDAYRASRSPTM
ncbi:Alpha/Beta hydrolase protein [Ostreococcus tauri]|nr:Alpha/Beta hydrolase protein [Ostreococcus tauri]